MTRLALLAVVVILAGACRSDGRDAATMDTTTVVVPADTLVQDTLRDTMPPPPPTP